MIMDAVLAVVVGIVAGGLVGWQSGSVPYGVATGVFTAHVLIRLDTIARRLRR